MTQQPAVHPNATVRCLGGLRSEPMLALPGVKPHWRPLKVDVVEGVGADLYRVVGMDMEDRPTAVAINVPKTELDGIPQDLWYFFWYRRTGS